MPENPGAVLEAGVAEADSGAVLEAGIAEADSGAVLEADLGEDVPGVVVDAGVVVESGVVEAGFVLASGQVVGAGVVEEVAVMVKVPVPRTSLPRCFTVHSRGGSQWVMTMSSVNPMAPTEVRAATPPPTPAPPCSVAQTRVSSIHRD